MISICIYCFLDVCQLPRYNLFTQHLIYLKESHLQWTMDPSPFFYIQSTNCLLLCVYFLQTISSFHSIRLILCFQQNRWDWQPHHKLGAEFYGCVVQVSTLLLAPVVRPAKVQLATPLGCFLAPTRLITLVSYWGKTCWCAHHTFLLGFPNELDIFWAIKEEE